jgi:hypothetical protein
MALIGNRDLITIIRLNNTLQLAGFQGVFTPVYNFGNLEYVSAAYEENRLLYVAVRQGGAQNNSTLLLIDLSTLQITEIGLLAAHKHNFYIYKTDLYTIFNAPDAAEKLTSAIFIQKICTKSAKVLKSYEYKNFHKNRADLYAHALDSQEGTLVFVWSLWNYDANTVAFDINNWKEKYVSSAMLMSDLPRDLMYVRSRY